MPMYRISRDEVPAMHACFLPATTRNLPLKGCSACDSRQARGWP